MNPTLTRLLIILPVLLWIAAPAQDLDFGKPEELGLSTQRLERIDQTFNSYVTENKMAGSVVLVARKGKVAYYKAFGFRDKESHSKMEVGSIFRIASQTKAIVSVGIMI